MAFPITVEFNKKLKAVVTADNQLQILEQIKLSISEDKADNIIIEETQVRYKGSTSNWRGSLFGSVDNGTFTLVTKNDEWWLNYKINMQKQFIITAIMSVAMGAYMFIGAGIRWVGFAAFAWLCGGNWIINVVRHDGVADTIAFKIDELIFGKIVKPEIEKIPGKLKSWF
jgi:hypothetical protein